MGDFATAFIKGRVVDKPEQRGKVAHFAIAVKAPSGTTSYVECEAWDERASWAVATIEKGDPVVVQGELYVSKWQAQDGSARKETRVKVWRIEFQEGKSSERATRAKDVDALLDSI